MSNRLDWILVDDSTVNFKSNYHSLQEETIVPGIFLGWRPGPYFFFKLKKLEEFFKYQIIFSY